MSRLVLDAGPLIAIASVRDTNHSLCLEGLQRAVTEFDELLVPVPIVCEVYKHSLWESPVKARQILRSMTASFTFVYLSPSRFQKLHALVFALPAWRGSLEDAAVVLAAREYAGSVWTLDYRDLHWFKQLAFWTP